LAIDPVFYQSILVIPALIYFLNKKLARVCLAAIGIIIFSLSVTNFVTLQFHQLLIILVSLILLIDQGSNVAALSTVTFMSTIGLPHVLLLVSLALFVFVALSVKRRQGEFGLCMLIIIPLTLILQYLQYPFADVALTLLLVGAPPFHKWLSNLYSSYRSTGILVALTALVNMNIYQASYASLTALIMFFSALMMIVGIFQSMACKNFTELYSTSHQITFGLLLVSAAVNELKTLFLYLLLPSVLSLAIIHFVHNNFAEKTKSNGMFEFGGLSAGAKVEAASTLTAYLILFTLMSLSAEVFMQIAMSGNFHFILLGCITLFVAAASLTAFFRNYTLIYEGMSKTDIPSSKAQKFAVTMLSGGNLVTALIPSSSFSFFWFVGRWQTLEFETVNILLLITLAAIVLSFSVVEFTKPAKKKSWTTGYTSVDELHESRGEVLTLWKEIFKPIYHIGVPDDKASQIVEKINPAILLLLFVILVVLGETI
jgi:hypothetical protein